MNRIFAAMACLAFLACATLGCNSRRNHASDAPPAAVAMQLTSTAIVAGGTIPVDYTCVGKNISPALAWSGAPAGAKSFALTVNDLDAPLPNFSHWLVWNLPAGSNGLPEAIPSASQLPSGAAQGTNDFHKVGYGGPCPPPGQKHRYRFVVYALDAALALPSGASYNKLIAAMDGHILAQGELTATFSK